ncbi:hypothetical protein AAVH_19852 [Aphelenchoides avenae]|nr:hypothetical protein AAVH_19852 [Aphelenchus avenae]
MPSKTMSICLSVLLVAVVAAYPAGSEEQFLNDTLKDLETKLLAQNEEFYKALDEKEREEVNQIVENHKLTKAQFKEKIQQWVDQLPADKKEKANKLDEQNMQIIEQMMKEVQSKNLSEQATKIFEEIQKITENDGITRREECEQITGKLNALPEADRSQLSIPDSYKLDCNKITQLPFEQKESA